MGLKGRDKKRTLPWGAGEHLLLCPRRYFTYLPCDKMFSLTSFGTLECDSSNHRLTFSLCANALNSLKGDGNPLFFRFLFFRLNTNSFLNLQCISQRILKLVQ